MASARYVRCTGCGANNRGEDDACYQCGAPFAQAADGPSPSVAAAAEVAAEMEHTTSALKWWFHAAVFALACWMALPYFTKPSHYGILEYAILPFHEAGHYFLMPFAPEFLVVLGGTLVQVGLPLGFAVYFLWVRKDAFASAVAAFWLCASLQAMAIYMKDARFLLLPLFGADPTDGHDWNYLFGKMGLLHQSVEIGSFFQGLGRVGMIAVLLVMGAWLVRNRVGKPSPR